MNETPDLWTIKSVAEVIKFMQNMPPEVQTLQFLAMAMVIVDTVTGVIKAIVMKDLSSRKMRTELLSKLGCYFGLASIGFVATVLTKAWFTTGACYTAIICIEFTSILENITILSKVGNINLGPAARFITAVSSIFESTQNKLVESTVVSNTTVIPKDISKEPIIQHTEVNKLQVGNSGKSTVQKNAPIVLVNDPMNEQPSEGKYNNAD